MELRCIGPDLDGKRVYIERKILPPSGAEEIAQMRKKARKGVLDGGGTLEEAEKAADTAEREGMYMVYVERDLRTMNVPKKKFCCLPVRANIALCG